MFSDVLKKLRKNSKMTQIELANRLNIDRTLIGKYELKNVMPSFDTLYKIADTFGVTMDYLLDYTSPEKKKTDYLSVKAAYGNHVDDKNATLTVREENLFYNGYEISGYEDISTELIVEIMRNFDSLYNSLSEAEKIEIVRFALFVKYSKRK